MAGDAADPSRVRVIYSGRVQGVGFRFTVLDISRRYDVAGFVRNRSDGSVELEAQGSQVCVGAFLDEIADTLAVNIQGVDRQTLPPPQPQERTARFEIRA